MAPDWFRATSWDEHARAEFEKRLARSRPWNRPQYLRIQGLTLWEAGDAGAARELLQRVLREYPEDKLNAAGATEHLAEIAIQQGHLDEAEAWLTRLLDRWHDLDGTSGTAEVLLADVLSQRDDPRAHEEAQRLLEAFVDRDGGIRWNSVMFTWDLVAIRLAEHRGDRAASARHAADALHLAAAGSQLPHHPDLGTVHTDEVTLQRLRRLVRATPRSLDAPSGPGPVHGAATERGLLDELAGVGVVCHDVWCLDTRAPGYERALPILLRHLRDDRYPDDVREGIAHALATPLAAPVWHQLADYFSELPDLFPRTRMSLAAALSQAATKEHLPEVIELLHDPQWGEDRIFFLRTLTRLRAPNRWSLIESLTRDPQVGPQARDMLKRKRRRGTRSRR